MKVFFYITLQAVNNSHLVQQAIISNALLTLMKICDTLI